MRALGTLNQALWRRLKGSLPHRRIGPRGVRCIAAASWTYLLLILTTALLIRFAGDRWWPATLLLFCHRSYSLWPLIILAPAGLVVRRRVPWILAVAAFIAVMFIMD